MGCDLFRGLALAGLAAAAATTTHADVLFEENFDGIPLGPIVTFGDSDSAGELPSREAWSNVAPAGWARDDSQVPGDPVNDGVREFRGWTFVDREWWIGTAGDQARSQWGFGYGVVAVADNDEFDDFSLGSGEGRGPSPDGCTPDADCYDASLTTPPISLAGVGENAARIIFDSSWRPEDQQDASLEVSFDGGEFTTLFTYNSVNADGTEPVLGDGAPTGQGTFTKVSGPDGQQIGDLREDLELVNEVVDIPLNNPAGANTVEVRWNMLEAGNDWWWAVDNVQVYTDTPGPRDPALRAIVDQGAGTVTIVNGTKDPIDLRGYQLLSGDGNFDVDSTDFLSEGDSDWVRLTADGIGGGDLSEGHLSSTTIAPGASIQLGEAWADYYRGEGDVAFDYLVDGVDGSVRGLVEFTGTPALFLDLDFDGDVDIFDWVAFLDVTQEADLGALTIAEAYRRGDLNRDRLITIDDFALFRSTFDTINGSGAFTAGLALLAVPEPTSALLIVVAAIGLRPRRQQ